MKPRHHTHDCKDCGVRLIDRCHGRDAGAPDCPSFCEFAPDGDFLCDDCADERRRLEDQEDAEDGSNAVCASLGAFYRSLLMDRMFR
ncbi:MAG TPA: hypothetical protein VMY35_11460 [Phycisphaerae bacterium]|nr:hypothetical protein [Phycisphaerae bacterium]